MGAAYDNKGRPASRRKRESAGAHGHTFDEVHPTGAPDEHLDISDMHNVKLAITADLGECTMLVREVIELQKGSVIRLNKLAGEMTDVFVNGLPLAKGEVVVIGDMLHVRIGEIIGAEGKSEESDVEHDDDMDNR